MEIVPGERVPVIGQGTWYMGVDSSQAGQEADALRHGLDLGMTLVDTAEMYHDAELVVGRALAGRRDEAFLVSKVLPSNASFEGTLEACERSLRRMDTDRIDLYLLHWAGSHPLEDTLAAFRRLVEQGKIRHYGVSNFSTRDMASAWRSAGGTAIASNQVLYNLGCRGIEWDLLPWCRDNRVSVMAYSPIDQGRLSHPVLDRVGQRRGATPFQVALAWSVRQDGVVAIPKSARPDHVRQNAEAASLVLDEQDLAELDDAFPPPQAAQPLQML